MRKTLTALLAIVLGTAIAVPETAPVVRSDLTPEDFARVAAVTAPTGDFSAPEDFEAMQGGAGTVTKAVNRDIFSFSAANLSFEQEEQFKLGNALFRKLWASSPSSTQASDGLGPLFNARSCQSCHLKDGRGHPPLDDGTYSESMFLRLSIPPQDENQRLALAERQLLEVPEPTYGTQLQEFAVLGVDAEGRMQVTYTDLPVTLGDGTVVTLRAPSYGIRDLAYGPLSPGVMMSPRVAQQMIGLGLLQEVPWQDILAHADPDDTDGNGVSGRPSWVRDPVSGDLALGRFGWKAGAPTIVSQAAGAFAGDIGISTPLRSVPHGDCTAVETLCTTAPTGVQLRLGDTEAPDPVLPLVTFYSENLGVPRRRDVDDPTVLSGKALFYTSGCPSCHVPKFVTTRETDNPAHRFQLIWPYTDLLLHDLGEGLADHRPEGDASGTEWRTPSLWGIGLTETVSGHTLFLHDGRARNLTEAILWHGGEAQTSRDAFATMTRQERAALLAFLASL